MKKKRSAMPRFYVSAVDRRELLAFLEAMRRAPQIVADLDLLLSQTKRARAARALARSKKQPEVNADGVALSEVLPPEKGGPPW